MDPYKVLGVDNDATDDEIKVAYRNLVKKYHPDRYHNNPLGELAEEKMRDINQAYDILTSKASSNSNYNTTSSYGNSSSYGNQSYLDIRNLINMGNIDQAIVALNSIQVHNAEWYYLRGVCQQRKGMYSQAQQGFATAARMDPNNMEYRRAANNMNNSNTDFTRGSRNTYGGGGCSICDICCALSIFDCLCNCC